MRRKQTPHAANAVRVEVLIGRIRAARLEALSQVNREMILTFWSIGQDIRARIEAGEAESEVIRGLTAVLQAAFPEMAGLTFTQRNLRAMRAFAESWPAQTLVEELAAQLPWTHHLVLLNGLDSPAERVSYARQAIENGWTPEVLARQIEFQRGGAPAPVQR